MRGVRRPCARRALIAAATVVALLLAGCVPAPPTAETGDAAVARTTASGHEDDTPSTVPVDTVTPAVRAASPQRLGQRATVRVRSLGCGRIGTASAVAVGRRALVTNRHVVEGVERIELNFWDGTSATARPTTVAVADDLALVRVSRRLPTVAAVAEEDAHPGSRVVVVGFPNGGRQRVAQGDVVEYAALERHPDASPVMRLSVPIAPGDSGGPVVNASGMVVGVVFGIETATGQGLAVPASAVRDLLAHDDTDTPSSGCR